MKNLFCKLYDAWLSKAVNEKTDPLVIFLDSWFGSNCKYCMATRALIAGFGLGFAFRSTFWSLVLGTALIALSWLMAWGERNWLCETPQGEQK